MDNRNNPEEQQEQDQQRRSGVDRANDLINKGRNTYNNAKRIRNVIRGARAAQGASTAVGSVGTAAATSEIWVPILIIILIVVAVVIIVLMLFGSSPTPGCAVITASSETTSTSTPVILTLDDCTPNVSFAWSSNVSGGTFNPTNSQSTSYTPPDLTTATPVTITATICSVSNTSLCSTLEIDLTITRPTCQILGGSCVPSNLCGAEGIGTISGGLADCRQNGSTNVCCNFGTSAPRVVYHCQGARKWNQTSCKLGNYGCAPTSLSMIFNAFGNPLTPLQVARNVVNDGCYNGTNVANHLTAIRNLGFSIPGNIVKYSSSYGGYAFNLNTAKYYLDHGYLLFAGSGPFRCLSTNSCAAGTGSHLAGHAFVIEDVNPANNTVTIRDPNTCSYAAWDDVERPAFNTRTLRYYYFGNFHHVFPIKKK